MFGELCDVLAFKKDSAAVGPDSAAGKVQQGGLSAAVGAYDRRKLSLVKLKGKVVEKGSLVNCSRVKNFCDIV